MSNTTQLLLLPSASSLKKDLPLSDEQSLFISSSREVIRQLLVGDPDRFLLIVGPCSIHDLKSAEEYAHRLKELSLKYNDLLFIVMRCFFEKPRTSIGWTGFLTDPLLPLDNPLFPFIEAREFLLRLASLQIPVATEFVNPLIAPYIEDLISWGCIGARTSSSPVHRQLVSHLPIPFGFKNALDGDTLSAVHAIQVASCPQNFIGLHEDGGAALFKTPGNKYTHLVLRGGRLSPNYTLDHLHMAEMLLRHHNLPQRIVIDCAHDNSNKCPNKQTEVLRYLIQNAIGHPTLMGVMLESNLLFGNQPFQSKPDQYGISITDPCIDWNTTEELITELYHTWKTQCK